MKQSTGGMNLDASSTSGSVPPDQEKKKEANNGEVAPSDWRKLFPAAADQTLQFFPPQRSEGKVRVSPPAEILEEGELLWRNAVVVQLIGRIPNFGYFQKMVRSLWGEEIDAKPVGHNLFIILFSCSEARDQVLENGPWHIQNKPLIVRRWQPGMKSLEFDMTRLPVWIQLGNIPLELFTQKGISYIASAIGNPLYMDKITASQQRLAFAKVCVEIEATTEMIRSIEVEVKHGRTVHVMVEYPWMPLKCSNCCVFGHGDKTCATKVVPTIAKIWKPKKVDTEEKVMEERKESNIVEETQVKQINGKERVKETTANPQQSSSTNRFSILESVIVESEPSIIDQGEVMVEGTNEEPRKVRAAAAGVADLMQSLKPKKGQVAKVKKKQMGSNAKGGQPSTISL